MDPRIDELAVAKILALRLGPHIGCHVQNQGLD